MLVQGSKWISNAKTTSFVRCSQALRRGRRLCSPAAHQGVKEKGCKALPLAFIGVTAAQRAHKACPSRSRDANHNPWCPFTSSLLQHIIGVLVQSMRTRGARARAEELVE